MISFTAVVDSYHVHSSSPFAMSDQVQGVGYYEFEVETNDTDALELEIDATAFELETDVAPLELEMDAAPLELEMETDVSQEILKQERYSTN
jgi:hypothetical protein